MQGNRAVVVQELLNLEAGRTVDRREHAAARVSRRGDPLRGWAITHPRWSYESDYWLPELALVEQEARERRELAGVVDVSELLVFRGPAYIVEKFEAAAISPQILERGYAALLWCSNEAWKFLLQAPAQEILMLLAKYEGTLVYSTLVKEKPKLKGHALRRLLFQLEDMELLHLSMDGKKIEEVSQRWDWIRFYDYKPPAYVRSV